MATKAARNQTMTSASKNAQHALAEVVPTGAVHDAIEYTRDRIRANPEAAALWCFGIGFILAWKIKPW
jgi:hypothetical protein